MLTTILSIYSVPPSSSYSYSCIHISANLLTSTPSTPNQSISLAVNQMEKPIKVESLDQSQHSRRLRSYPSSPEFEFWMVRNPSLPQLNMLTADELFVDGVLLPLDLVPVSAATVISLQESESASADVAVGPELTAAFAASEPVTGSRRWKDIFKKASKEIDDKVESKTTKMNKKRERKLSSGGGGGTSSAELNINIWPFSRSRSAGTGGARPKVATGSRKISSAPCSRSNSGGESKSRKWPASPGRTGVHVGRSSPVWQVRPRPSKASEAAESRKGKPVKVCKEGSSGAYGGDFGRRGCSRKVSGGSIDGTGVVTLFNLRSLFSKKVY